MTAEGRPWECVWWLRELHLGDGSPIGDPRYVVFPSSGGLLLSSQLTAHIHDRLCRTNDFGGHTDLLYIVCRCSGGASRSQATQQSLLFSKWRLQSYAINLVICPKTGWAGWLRRRRMREDGWWDPGASEIQAAIRSLRLRFTEISRTGTGDFDLNWD